MQPVFFLQEIPDFYLNKIFNIQEKEMESGYQIEPTI